MNGVFYHKNKIILTIIIVSSVILALFSYNFFLQTTNQIQGISVDELQTNSEIEISSISKILSNTINYIKSNLERISESPSIVNMNLTRIGELLTQANDSTNYLTDSYYLLSKNGTLLTFTGIEKEQNLKYKGVNLSYRDYFKIPKQYGIPYISTVIDSNDKVPRIYISYPIIHETPTKLNEKTKVNESSSEINPNTFDGVVVASIKSKTLGQYLESQLHPKLNGNVGFIDRDGTVIYTQNTSLIGKKYFGEDFQSYLKSILKGQYSGFNRLVNNALHSESGVENFNFDNTATIMAYQAVSVSNLSNNHNNVNEKLDGNRLGTLFIAVPNTLANDVITLINNQRITNFLIILTIASISTVMAFIVLRWNRILERTVRQKTTDLSGIVNELKKANEDLKQHEKMQREFINVAAHELRTPTQAISGNLELIEELYIPSIVKYATNKGGNIQNEFQSLLQDKEKLYEFSEGFASIYRNSQRLEKLVNDILDVSRIESNKLKIHKEHFNLNEKIINVIKDIHNKINYHSTGKYSKQIAIIYEPLQDPIPVFADKIRIFEVLSNLIDNAIKFSSNEPIIISIDIVKDSLTQNNNTYSNNIGTLDNEINQEKNKNNHEMAVVSITDKGKGIDDEILPRLFNKFISKSEQGTGLGLYLAKNIIEAHGGKIWAQNNKDGKGATFAFSIPLSPITNNEK